MFAFAKPSTFRPRIVLGSVCITVTLGLADCGRCAEPPGRFLSKEQQAKIQERNRLWRETKQLHAAGKLPEAIAAAEKVLTFDREFSGENHGDVVGSLQWLGQLHEQRDDFAAARKTRKEIVDIQIKLNGKEHWRVTDARLALADVELRARLDGEQRKQLVEANRLNRQILALIRNGRSREAIPPAERALALRKQVLGDKHPSYATSLNNLAELYFRLGDYAKAEPLYRQASEICKQVLGEKHPLYATSLNNLAALYKSMGVYIRAEQLSCHASEIYKQTLGEKHPDYATSLNNLAELYKSMGDFAKAEPLCRQALNIRKQTLGEKHPNYAQSLNNLAALHHRMGVYAKAESLYRQVLAMRKRTLGENHPDYATSLNNLARLYQSMGDYAKVESFYRQAAEIYKQALGDKHPLYGTSLHNLAELYYRMGDYAKAEPLFHQTLAIAKQSLGDKHPAYAASLNNLAVLYKSMDDYARAEPLYLRASEIYKQALGDKHSYYAASLNNLAELYRARGDYAKAEPLYRQASEIFKQALGEKHPDYASSLHNLAGLYRAIGDYARAEPLYRQTLAIRKQTLGDKHPDYVLSLNNLALLHLVKNEGSQSLKLARQSWQIIHAQLDLTANVQSERQQLRMNDQYRGYLDSVLSAATAARTPAAEVYAEVLAWKGTVSLRQQHMRRLRRELTWSGPETARLYTDLETATRRLATLLNTTPGPRQIDTYRQRLDDANAEVERRQQALAAASAAFRIVQAQQRCTPKQLRQALPPGVALVDLLEYGHFTPRAKQHETWERRLTAFVVRKDRPVAWVDLGPVATLTEDVERWRVSIRRRTRPAFSSNDPAALLREQLWQPLEPYLKDAATILISPDGVVARLPWGALPGATPDKYLIEERNLSVIAVPQFLPEMLADAKKADAPTPSLLVVGDVDYEAAAGRADAAIASRGLATVLQRGGGASWTPLPGTKQEMTAIRALYQRCFPAGTAKLLDEGAATEGAMREAAPRYVWLHLATHGYFAPQKVNAALGQDNKVRTSALSLAEQRGFVGFPQGLLAGVVLSGANKGGGDGEDDGILTALEVAELDLRGVELAVLSACETGLGARAGGEGLLGLQRAFQVAGAHSVAASLWSVPDKATCALMERFYANLWQKKMGRLAALREAQLWMLQEGRKQSELRRGLDLVRDEADDAANKRLPPYYWAAFVLSGDWR